jgi:hypothetical protein
VANVLELKLRRLGIVTLRVDPPDGPGFDLPLATRNNQRWIEVEWQRATRFVGWVDSPKITRDVRTSQADILTTRIWPHAGYRASELRVFHVAQWGDWQDPGALSPLAVIGKCHARNFQPLWGAESQAVRLPTGLCRIVLIQENQVLADLDGGLPEMYKARTLYTSREDAARPEEFVIRGTYQTLEETLSEVRLERPRDHS